MRSLRIVFELALASILVISIYQGINIRNLIAKSDTINIGQSRAEVHQIIGLPVAEWAKASNLDFWRSDFLLGGLAIDILYQGQECCYENRERSSEECIVQAISTRFYTLWGNNKILYFKIR